MAADAPAPAPAEPESPTRRKLPKCILIPDEHCASCGDLVRPRVLLNRVAAQTRATAVLRRPVA